MSGSYSQLSVILKSTDTMTAAKLFLEHLEHLATNHDAWTEDRKVSSSGMVGGFLASYMIAYHPKTVFECTGSQETQLLRSAERLLASVYSVISLVLSQSSDGQRSLRGYLLEYTSALYDYRVLFLDWKAQDQARLTDRIQRSLYAIIEALQQPQIDSQTHRDQLMNQAAALRDRLRRIAGKAALEDFDKKHPELVSVGPPPSATAGWLEEPMNNEQLAHEVLLDPTYRLPIDSDLDGRISSSGVKAVMQKAFWSGVEEDLRLVPPSYGRVIRVLSQVRDGVVAIAPASVKERLSEMVDEELIRQQAEKGLYRWKECVALIQGITSKIAEVQTAERRAETEAAWVKMKVQLENVDVLEQPGMFCRGLRFLLSRANAARADAGNARLLRLAPVIKEHGFDYERSKFDAKEKSQSVKLDHTREWLRTALLNRPEMVSEVASGRKHLEVLSWAYADLAAEFIAAKCPETLLLDVVRLRALTLDTRRFVCIATAVLAARKVLADSRLPVRSIGESAALVTDALLRLENVLDSEVGATEAAEAAGAAAGLGDISVAVRVAVHASITAPAGNLEKLLRKRIIEVWRRAASGVDLGDDTLLGSGLEALWLAVVQAAKLLGRVAEVNRQVYAERYSRILKEEALKISQSLIEKPVEGDGSCLSNSS